MGSEELAGILALRPPPPSGSELGRYRDALDDLLGLD
jgi:hypothetical protein